jgi:hypothetical protein
VLEENSNVLKSIKGKLEKEIDRLIGENENLSNKLIKSEEDCINSR